MLESICSIVRRAEENYVRGTTNISEYVVWSMHETIERIDAYLNSKHISGEKDSLGRDKPFFNIVIAASNIWYRATDLDRKDIRFIPKNSRSVVLAFVANILLQNWMDKTGFGTFLNNWGRTLARYGSAVPKFVEKGGQLYSSVVPWNRLIVDSIDFEALPRIEKLFKTPAQLRADSMYDKEAVEGLLNAITTRKTIDGIQKDNQNDFIEIYEVHGKLDSRLLQDNPNMSVQPQDVTYIQQMHVVSFVGTGKKGKDGLEEYQDYTLYKGRERKDPYKITSLIEEDGRTLGIGAVESLFDSQWQANHTVKNMKDTLDITSKLIMQTSDARFQGRNVLTAIETGDIFVHEDNKPLTRVANDNPSIVALQNYGSMWQRLATEITSTPDAIRGTTLPSGTPYSLGAFLGAQANSLFEIMTENKGLQLEDMLREYVIPHLRKQLKNKEDIVAILDSAGIEEIDAIYVPLEATRRYNEKAKRMLIEGEIPEPFNPQTEQGAVKQELQGLGNRRFFRPSEFSDKQWDEVFADFEWDNIRVEVTNENTDKQAVLTTLSSVLQTIAGNPAILQDPNAKMIFSQILTETGRISPLQISSAASPPIQGNGTEALNELTANETAQ